MSGDFASGMLSMASIVECGPNAVYCVGWDLRPSSGPLKRFESAVRFIDEVCKAEEDASRHLARTYPTRSSQIGLGGGGLMTASAAAAVSHASIKGKRVVGPTHC